MQALGMKEIIKQVRMLPYMGADESGAEGSVNAFAGKAQNEENKTETQLNQRINLWQI